MKTWLALLLILVAYIIGVVIGYDVGYKACKRSGLVITFNLSFPCDPAEPEANQNYYIPWGAWEGLVRGLSGDRKVEKRCDPRITPWGVWPGHIPN